jgi:hypothetical protein
VNEVIVIAPILRYITKKCFDSEFHIENYGSDDFESVIAGVEALKRMLEGWALDYSLKCGLIDATKLVDPVELSLRNRITQSRIPLWADGNPMHLTCDADKELAKAILDGEYIYRWDIRGVVTGQPRCLAKNWVGKGVGRSW